MKTKHMITLAIIMTTALLVAACGTAPEPGAEPAAPSMETDTRPRPPEGGPGGRGGGMMQIIVEETGLDIEAIQQQSAEGATLAELITANGGNVDEVKARLVEAMRQMPDTDEAQIEERVTEMLNNPMSQFGPGEGRGPRQSE